MKVLKVKNANDCPEKTDIPYDLWLEQSREMLIMNHGYGPGIMLDGQEWVDRYDEGLTPDEAVSEECFSG